MKVLFITSFYSALKTSVLQNHWQPTGMPAITKLFEGLKTENIEFDNIFISRTQKKNDHIILKNDFFFNTMCIMSVKKNFDVKYFRIIDESITSLTLYRKIRKMISNKNHDVIYVDRANIVIGALFAYNGFKVVLRFHGISVLYEHYSKIFNQWLKFWKTWSFKAPFKYIICSEDGTPTQQFLAKFSNPKVISKILLNGIDVTKASVYAPLTRKKLKLTENPFSVMECTVIDERYMNLGHKSDSAFQAIHNLKANCMLFNGNFVVSFHNHRFADEREKDLYLRIINS